MIATPTGFKDARWLVEVRQALLRAQRTRAQKTRAQKTHSQGSEAHELCRTAREAFLWWSEVPDAMDWVQLGRMLCACEVIWRPLAGEPQDTPAQVEVRQRALGCFLRAQRLDSSAPVPRAEFRRLADLLGSDEQLALSENPDAPFQGGYREGYIRHAVGDAWRVRLPGWLREGYDAGDGHDVFWDGRFTVHLTPSRHEGTFEREAEIARHLACLPAAARGAVRMLPIDQDAIQGYALVLEGEALSAMAGLGPADLLVLGQVAAGDERVSFTAVSQSKETSPLALRLPRDFSLARVE